MRGLAVALLSLCSCNTVFGLDPTLFADAAPIVDAIDAPPPDLDGDGIADPEDGCIASPSDAVGTVDGDALANDMDPCPFDVQMTGDADADAIQDRCDPFPSDGGDRYRCVMVFKNPDLNRRVWMSRPGGGVWNTGANGLLTVNQDALATLIAVPAIEFAGTTTFDAWMSIGGNSESTVPHRARVLVRADPLATTEAGDIGCEITGRTAPQLSITGTNATMPLASSIGVWRVRVTVAPASIGVNLRCTAWRDNTTPVTVSAMVPLTAGNFGFTSEASGTSVFGLAVYDRDDAPPLP